VSLGGVKKGEMKGVLASLWYEKIGYLEVLLSAFMLLLGLFLRGVFPV
jgi:hypothetical protein